MCYTQSWIHEIDNLIKFVLCNQSLSKFVIKLHSTNLHFQQNGVTGTPETEFGWSPKLNIFRPLHWLENLVAPSIP